MSSQQSAVSSERRPETVSIPTVSNMVRERRIGRFTISEPMIFGLPDEVMLKIFERVVVIRCEYLYHSRRFDFIAYSPDFAPVAEMLEPRMYAPVVIENRDGGDTKYTVEWR